MQEAKGINHGQSAPHFFFVLTAATKKFFLVDIIPGTEKTFRVFKRGREKLQDFRGCRDTLFHPNQKQTDI